MALLPVKTCATGHPWNGMTVDQKTRPFNYASVKHDADSTNLADRTPAPL